MLNPCVNTFLFLAYQRSLQILYELLSTQQKLGQFLQSDNLSFVDRQTCKSKDLAPKQHLGKKNNLAGYHRPNYFSTIGPDCSGEYYSKAETSS